MGKIYFEVIFENVLEFFVLCIVGVVDFEVIVFGDDLFCSEGLFGLVLVGVILLFVYFFDFFVEDFIFGVRVDSWVGYVVCSYDGGDNCV